MRKNIIPIVAVGLLLSFSLTGCGSKSKQTISKGNEVTPNKVVSTATDSDKKGQTSADKGNSGTDNTKNTETTEAKAFTPVVVPDINSLATKKIGWSWAYSPKDDGALISKYHGYAFGDTSKKNIYLTFDEGYEYGYTGSLLDTLKANNVKATFFVTQPYVKDSFNGVKDSDLVQRMASEGHTIGNHTVHHLSMPDIKDESKFDAELTGVEDAVKAIPGAKVSKFFRPPMGDFSELSLYYAQKLGYRTIFFAFAYIDYDVKNQPDPEKSKQQILKNTKPGMICLLHAESKTNATILDSLIKEWKNEGYEFKSLNELE